MKLIKKKIADLFLPSYVIGSLRKLDWLDSTDDTITFHPDDFILIHYGTRGSTSHTGPKYIRYGSNTTSFQIFSPKLPARNVYLGDGGSGILEIDRIIIKKLFAMGFNPFEPPTGEWEGKPAPVSLINFYTHYHYDHLHFGLPLAAVAHANHIPKMIIGGDNPKQQFRTAFRRPNFPRDFGEISSSYDFFQIKDPRSTVIIFLPDGDFKALESSVFEQILLHTRPQIKHKGMSHNIEDCIVKRILPVYHPDPCNSFRYENYDETGKLVNACTFMTDHDMQEVHGSDGYYIKQIEGADYVYFDGQYDNESYIAGYGHGRVEVLGEVAAKMKLPFVGIGHHDPSRSDNEVDELIRKAKSAYKNAGGDEESAKIVGASDRMMIFIPAKSRGRSGIVFGRMDVGIGEPTKDDIGSQHNYHDDYKPSDLTTRYNVYDESTSPMMV